MLNLSPIYCACKSSNHKLIKNHKISPVHKIYIKQNKRTSNKIFKKLVPSVSPLLKKHIRLGHTGIEDHSIDLSIPDFKKVFKKKGQKQEIFFKYINA